MDSQSDRYYSTSEVGRRLGVSRQRIDQLLRSGELEGEQDPDTGRWRISSAALNEYLSTHQPRTPRRRLEDHPAFMELKGEVKALEVRLGVVERLLGELRTLLLGSIYEREADGEAASGSKNEPSRDPSAS
jgi:excisionase family DNA binding protein